jgi:hypothetical protein
LVVVLVFALIGTELLAFIKKVVVPCPAQELDIAGLGGGPKRLRTLELATLNGVRFDGITE